MDLRCYGMDVMDLLTISNVVFLAWIHFCEESSSGFSRFTLSSTINKKKNSQSLFLLLTSYLNVCISFHYITFSPYLSNRSSFNLLRHRRVDKFREALHCTQYSSSSKNEYFISSNSNKQPPFLQTLPKESQYQGSGFPPHHLTNPPNTNPPKKSPIMPRIGSLTLASPARLLGLETSVITKSHIW